MRLRALLTVLCSDNGAVLSYLSVDFLNLEDVAAREQFLTSNRGYVPKQMTAVTCMETLCKGVEGDQAVSRYPRRCA